MLFRDAMFIERFVYCAEDKNNQHLMSSADVSTDGLYFPRIFSIIFSDLTPGRLENYCSILGETGSFSFKTGRESVMCIRKPPVVGSTPTAGFSL